MEIFNFEQPVQVRRTNLPPVTQELVKGTPLWEEARKKVVQEFEEKNKGKMVLPPTPREVDDATFHMVTNTLERLKGNHSLPAEHLEKEQIREERTEDRIREGYEGKGPRKREAAEVVIDAADAANNAKRLTRMAAPVAEEAIEIAPELAQAIHPSQLALEQAGYHGTATSAVSTALTRGLGIIAARDAIDELAHSTTRLAESINPVAGNVAHTAEDILQFSLNPFTWLAAPVYIPYRIGSAIYEGVTGNVDPIRTTLPDPYDVRPLAILDPIKEIVSPVTRLIGIIGDLL